MFELAPGAEAAFLDAYRPRVGEQPLFEARLLVAGTLELVKVVANAKTRDNPTAASAIGVAVDARAQHEEPHGKCSHWRS